MKRRFSLPLHAIALSSLLFTGCQTDNEDRTSRDTTGVEPSDRISRNGSGTSDRGSSRAAERDFPATQPSEPQRVMTDAAKLRSTNLAAARGGPAKGKRSDRLQSYALFTGPMPTGVTVSQEGRVFLSFPRWGDPVNWTVAEIRDGQLVPYPDGEINSYYPDDPQRLPARDHFVSVQSVVVDPQDRLWMVDTGSINFQPPTLEGAKLVAYDLKSNQRVKDIRFPREVIKTRTYLNDVRFDLSRGQGFAYLTDSGEGGIVVVDLGTGESWRKLDGHPSVMPEFNFVPNVEGQPLQVRQPGQRPQPIQIAADGIALSPDGATLYWTPLASRKVYFIPTAMLTDRNRDRTEVEQAVKVVATKPSANDGLEADSNGRIYSTDYEDNAIRRISPGSGQAEILLQDERLLWPDTLAFHAGHLYVTANQLHRQPLFNDGKDRRNPPYVLFRIPVDASGASEPENP